MSFRRLWGALNLWGRSCCAVSANIKEGGTAGALWGGYESGGAGRSARSAVEWGRGMRGMGGSWAKLGENERNRRGLSKCVDELEECGGVESSGRIGGSAEERA